MRDMMGQDRGGSVAKGFISGMIWGVVASGIGLAVLSLAAPLPAPPEAASEAPAGGGAAAVGTEAQGQTGAEMQGSGRDGDVVELPPTAPAGTEGAPDTLAPMDSADTEPAALPQVGDAGGALDAPGAGADVAGVTVDPGDTPVASAPQAPVPSEPDAEVALSISTEPAQPAAPDVAEETVFAPAPEADAGPQVAAASDPGLAAPDADTLDRPVPDVSRPQVDQAPAAPPGPPDAPRMAALPQIGVDGSTPPAAPQAPAMDTPLPSQGSLLPRVGDDDTAPPAVPGPPVLPPIQANGEPFENLTGKPLMSIILIDGPGSVGAEALADFPYPLTFAIDPTQPDAVEKMRAYRLAGFEVVALIDLPPAAQPADAEMALDAGFHVLPEAVAVLEGTGSGIQGNRALSDQVTRIVGQDGYGLITQDNGLNTVPKLAEKAGVPTAVVFRDFDGAGQTPAVMRRFLDQAAFRAGQQGSVVMLGRVQPDTVSALLLWGLQDRASRVALAPITAILTKVH